MSIVLCASVTLLCQVLCCENSRANVLPTKAWQRLEVPHNKYHCVPHQHERLQLTVFVRLPPMSKVSTTMAHYTAVNK